MAPSPRERLPQLLALLARDIDIPPGKYAMAVERYQAVAGWLNDRSSPLACYHPQVYPQGSFRLGTVVRPLREGLDADYDIDLVCELTREKAPGEEREVKHSVGNRLKASETYRKMLEEEGSRCWTIAYADVDDVGFHIDCLPCVPEQPLAKQLLLAKQVPWTFAQWAIGITHKSSKGEYGWLSSNPKGYAAWFEAINKRAFDTVSLTQKRDIYAHNRELYRTCEEVPDALVRTPLQQAIQLLKRHRDWSFTGHPLEDQKPISIIITTLVASVHRGEADVLGVLEALLDYLRLYPDSGIIRKVDGRWTLINPVNPAENFADRWNDPGSQRSGAFFDWIDLLRGGISKACQAQDSQSVVEALSRGFDRQQLERLAEQFYPVRTQGGSAPSAILQLADHRHAQQPLWPISLLYKVRVRGTVHSGLRTLKVLWNLSDRPLPKELGLRFKAETNCPAPYSVQWQVVNTGSEAIMARGLRGGFENGEGNCGSVKWESTQYKGAHWIEAFVIKDGRCVARSGRVSVRIS